MLEAVDRGRAARGAQPLPNRGPSYYTPVTALDLDLANRISDEVFSTAGLPAPPSASALRAVRSTQPSPDEPPATAPPTRASRTQDAVDSSSTNRVGPRRTPRTNSEIDELIASTDRMLALVGKPPKARCLIQGCDCRAATISQHEKAIEYGLLMTFDAELMGIED